MKKIVCLCGGVGGAKLALGFSKILPPEQLTIVVNTGDDFEHLGFSISPDIDTVIYTLAGISNKTLGWGIEDETWNFMAELEQKNPANSWFKLGDKDLQTHRLRKHHLSQGRSLTDVTTVLAHHHQVRHRVLPMSDSKLRTVVHTPNGKMPFQHYFVREQCKPAVTGFEFEGLPKAAPTSQVMLALSDPELAAVVICPSNPFVSIDPILSLRGMRDKLKNISAPLIAVSPIIGGQAIKGPTAKMMDELKVPKTSAAIAQHYGDLLDILVIDTTDQAQTEAVTQQGIRCVNTQTLMKTDTDKEALARFILSLV